MAKDGRGAEKERPCDESCFSQLDDSLNYCAPKDFVVDGRMRQICRELDTFCEHQNGGDVPLVIAGESGVGKSALLAYWTSKRREQDDEDEFLLASFVGCSRYSQTVENILRRLVDGLVGHFNLRDMQDIADDKLSWALPRVLNRASQKGRITLLFDGLHLIGSCDRHLGLKGCLARCPTTCAWLSLPLFPANKIVK